MMKNNFIMVIAAILGISAIAFFYITTLETEKLGSVGDFFGGVLNPAFAFLSLIAILTTIKLQSDELEQTREELRRSAKAQENSERIFKKQQFESTFFSILAQLNIFINEFMLDARFEDSDDGSLKKKNNILIIWERVVDALCHSLGYKQKTRHYTMLTVESFLQPIEVYKDSIQKISILIYQLLKIVEAEDFEFREKKKYTNILRACLNNELLQILSVYWCREDLESMKKYKSLVEKYAVLEHMSFILVDEEYPNPLLRVIREKYDLSAFGDSDYLNKLLEFEREIGKNK